MKIKNKNYVQMYGLTLCVQSETKVDELQWESAQETEKKTWRYHMRHGGLLGLKCKGFLNEVVHHCRGPKKNCLYGVRRQRLCVCQVKGDEDYMLCKKGSLLSYQHPKGKNLDQRDLPLNKMFP